MEYLKIRHYRRNCWLLFIDDMTVYLVKKDKNKDDFVPVAFVRDGKPYVSSGMPKWLKNEFLHASKFTDCIYFEDELKHSILNFQGEIKC